MVYHEKIWVHRTNSIEKLNEVQHDYYGVELDVEYIDSTDVFDVNHPPAKSIGLDLSTYIESTKENKKLHFWLDFKNLNVNNEKRALERLLSICDNHHLKPSNFIVENGEMDLLQDFQKAGFNVSYYLNWPGLYTLNSKELSIELQKINNTLANNLFPCYISSDYRDYEILKKHFPDRKILSWFDDNFFEQNNFKNRIKLIEMLNDNQVEVLLFRHKSKLYER